MKPTIGDYLWRCFRGPAAATMFLDRSIRLDGTVYPVNTVTNAINNRKYSILSFVPMVLFNQFKYFFNMFFLLLALTQFWEPLKVGRNWSNRFDVLLRCTSGFCSGSYHVEGRSG